MDTEKTSENCGEAWDCDLFFVSECLDYDLGLDEEDDEGDRLASNCSRPLW